MVDDEERSIVALRLLILLDFMRAIDEMKTKMENGKIQRSKKHDYTSICES